VTPKKDVGFFMVLKEEENMSVFEKLDRDWASLPVLATIDGLGLRWAGPLVDRGHEMWLSDMGQAAWGYLEGCGWSEMMPEGGALNADGHLKKEWGVQLAKVARTLAEEGTHAGPESDPERWLAWLCVEMSEPRQLVRVLMGDA